MSNPTVAQLKTRALRMADHENSGFISAAEATDLVREAIREYIDMVEDPVGLEFLAQSYEFTTTPGSASYTVGNGTTSPYMYKLLAVQVTFDGRRHPVRKSTLMGMLDPDMGNGWTSPGAVRYTMGPISSGARTLLFFPAPQAAHAVTVLYVPVVDTLDDSTIIPGLMGWDEFVVLSMAIKILDKEESDTKRLEARLEKCRARIMQAIADSDAGQTDQISDVSGMGLPSIRDLPWEGWFW